MYRMLILMAFASLTIAVLSASAASLECSRYQTRACGSNVGACNEGLRVCTNGEWGDCIGAASPQPEICGNGIDDDCDGATDECIAPLPAILVAGGISLFAVMGLLFKMGY